MPSAAEPPLKEEARSSLDGDRCHSVLLRWSDTALAGHVKAVQKDNA